MIFTRLPQDRTARDTAGMTRSSAALVGVVLILTAGCHAREPEICRSSPPENAEGYERWEEPLAAAHCQRPHGDHAPSGNQSHAGRGD